MNFTVLEDMYAFFWEMLYKVFVLFGIELSNPYEKAE